MKKTSSTKFAHERLLGRRLLNADDTPGGVIRAVWIGRDGMKIMVESPSGMVFDHDLSLKKLAPEEETPDEARKVATLNGLIEDNRKLRARVVELEKALCPEPIPPGWTGT